MYRKLYYRFTHLKHKQTSFTTQDLLPSLGFFRSFSRTEFDIFYGGWFQRILGRCRCSLPGFMPVADNPLKSGNFTAY